MNDDLSAASIIAALTALRSGSFAAKGRPRLGHPVLFFPCVGSTNDIARELAEAGAAEGLVVVADEQTAGRGRLDRRWWAPPGSSLLMSLLLRPSIPAIQAGQLTMCLGLGAVEAIEETTGLRPVLKWPNDLLLDGRKLGGILTELQLSGERLAYAVLGLGVNVNLPLGGDTRANSGRPEASSCVPGDVAGSAISLFSVLRRPVPRAELLACILLHCEAWYDRLLGGESPHGAWAARLDTLGRAVTVATPAGPLHGFATGVTTEGALLLQTSDGQTHTIWAGDVAAVR